MTNQLGRQIVGIAKLQLLTASIGLLTQIYLARLLGPEQKGILDLFVLVPTILASLSDFGLLSANTYFAGKNQISIRILHSHSICWAIVASCFIMGAGVLLQDSISALLKGLVGWNLLVAVVLAGPTMYIALWSSLMYGINRVRTVYLFNIFTGIGALVLYLILGTFLTLSINVFLIATAAFTVTKAIWAFLVTEPESLPILRFDVHSLKRSLGYGIPLYFGLIINVLHFRLSQFFVNWVGGAADLANFALASRMAEILWLMDYAIINASIFRITSTSPEEAAEITGRMGRIVGFMIFLASVGVALAAPFVVPFLFGKAFSPAVMPLIILLPGVLLWSIGRVLAQFIAYQMGKPWLNLRASFTAFAVNVLLMVILVPPFGIVGAAVSTSISFACNYAFLAFAFIRITKMGFSSMLIPTKGDFDLAIRVARDQFGLLATR